jgi:hypothetical protein
VQAQLLGDPKKITESKAKIDSESGEYVGGIEFERHASASSIQPSNRAYGLSTSIQLARNMDAPHKGRKTVGNPLSERGTMIKKVLRVRYSSADSYNSIQSQLTRDIFRQGRE